MSCRVLFVDDDEMLLASMDRCLGMKFDLQTAPSGAAALQKMQDVGPFPVVVTDMRMPGMDGIQFIEQAREVSKHSVFVMLTGNQDVHTAVLAVNEGRVFRFLNKPCDPAEITSTIQHAYRQYQLEASERELLNQTFLGTLGIFADVIETLQPELMGRAGRTEQLLEALRVHCGIDSRWEYKVAAKLLLLGYAMQGGSARQHHKNNSEAVVELGRASAVAAKLVQRVPRLDTVAEIIRCVATTDGATSAARGEGLSATEVGAALLRVAHQVETASSLGFAADEAAEQIQELLPNIDGRLLDAVRAVYPSDVRGGGVPVDVDDLRPGMVLVEDLVRTDGAILLRSGRELSLTHIEKLRYEKESRSEHPPVVVTRASFLEAYPESAAELAAH